MDSKGLITSEEFSHFCNRVVPLVIMEKNIAGKRTSEQLRGKIQVANYSENALKGQHVNGT